MRHVLGGLLFVTVTGCAQATMNLEDVKSPVMLGPVQRIGGARAASQERVVGTVEGEVFDFAAASESRKNLGGGVVVVKRETTAVALDASDTSTRIRTVVGDKTDRDTRIDGVNAGAWFFITMGAAMQERWVGIEGRVVEVANAK